MEARRDGKKRIGGAKSASSGLGFMPGVTTVFEMDRGERLAETGFVGLDRIDAKGESTH